MNKFIIFVFIFASFVFSDTITLNNKVIIKGDVVLEDTGWVKLRTPQGTIVLISKDDIYASDIKRDQWVRYSEIKHGYSLLEVATKYFKDKSGRVIALVGVVHIADKSYYEELQTTLDNAQIVLFEGVGSELNEDLSKWIPTSAEMRKKEIGANRKIVYESKSVSSPLDLIGQIQSYAGTFLDLTFQKEGINYNRSWWKPADVTIEELQESMEEKQVSFLDFVLNANKQEFSINSRISEKFAGVIFGKEMSVAGKEVFGKLLADQQEFLSDFDGANDLMEILIDVRNDKVISVLNQTLKNPDIKDIAIFYGAGHNQDLEEKIEKLGFQEVLKEWDVAWEIIDNSWR